MLTKTMVVDQETTPEVVVHPGEDAKDKMKALRRSRVHEDWRLHTPPSMIMDGTDLLTLAKNSLASLVLWVYSLPVKVLA
jgi:hypothetical protein